MHKAISMDGKALSERIREELKKIIVEKQIQPKLVIFILEIMSLLTCILEGRNCMVSHWG